MARFTTLSQSAAVILSAYLAITGSALLTSKAGCGLSELACPGSPLPSSQHSACSQVLQFSDSCQSVQAEIEARINGQKDRKASPGSYVLQSSQSGSFSEATTVNGNSSSLSQSGGCTKASRTTGPGAQPGPFTDLFGFRFMSDGGGCKVTSCSESQVQSKCDFSTNFCNLFNLYCNKADACEPLLHDLTYTTLSVGDSCNHGESCSPSSGGWENQTSLCTRR